MINKDTIVALATPNGYGAISVIRISGSKSFSIIDSIFKAFNSKKIKDQKSNTIHLGYIFNKKKILDEVLISLFKSPNSYTSEDVIEISCHGSPYIVDCILQLLIQKGARIARAGEFTLRSFLNGKMDLSQAEAVADLIFSESQADHYLAINQLKGSISNQIKLLRSKLIDFASLIELDLDFSEENIESFNKSNFLELLEVIEKHFKILLDSFSLGNSIKKGITVAIIGYPNVGKSTLLNTLLKEERSIISNIPGTTRDIIEGQIIISGIRFRFIDTAGIRNSKNKIEILGIKKTFEYIEKSKVIFYIFDLTNFHKEFLLKELDNLFKNYPNKIIFIIANKIDLFHKSFSLNKFYEKIFYISAKKGKGINKLFDSLYNLINHKNLKDNTLITNIRHYEALKKALNSIQNIKQSINKKISNDLLSTDIRFALDCLGEISGEISSEELLNNIFSKFCIGK